MTPSRIDAISRLFARRRAAGTPVSNPVAPLSDAEHGPEMLFVQSFQSGRIVPRDNATGRYSVTLEHGLGETIFFSDRPDRVTGTTPTPQFLDGLGFSSKNPPNAALLIDTASGETDLAVVELFTPVYDATTHTVSYEIAVLDAWETSAGQGFADTPTDLSGIPSEFGTAHLFIDDCADEDITCVNYDSGDIVGTIPNGEFDGWCYSWWPAARCLPCQPWNRSYGSATFYWDSICRKRFCEESGTCWAEFFH